MGLTELLILISILVIVAIVLRVIVAAMNSRKNKIRIALEKNIPEYDLEELELRELPSGGARMVQRSFEEVMRQASELDNREAAKHRVPRSKVLKTDLSREAVLARRAALLAAGGSLATAEQSKEPDLFADMPPLGDAEPPVDDVQVVDAEQPVGDVPVVAAEQPVGDVPVVVEAMVSEPLADPVEYPIDAEAGLPELSDVSEHIVDDAVVAELVVTETLAEPVADLAETEMRVDEAVVAAVLAADAQTPSWAAAAVRADEYDVRTQSTRSDFFNDNDWQDDVSPVREVRIERVEPRFSEMRFDENLGLVDSDTHPLESLPAEPTQSATEWVAEPAPAVDVAFEPEPDVEFEPEPEPEPEPEFAFASSAEPEFAFGSAIAPHSEFDLEMDRSADDDDDEFEDDEIEEDFDERDIAPHWFIDDADDEQDSEPDDEQDSEPDDEQDDEQDDESDLSDDDEFDADSDLEDDVDADDDAELEVAIEPAQPRIVPELDDMLDELLHERGVSTDVDYSVAAVEPEPEPEPEPEFETESDADVRTDDADADDAKPENEDDYDEEPLPDFDSELEVEPEPQPQPVDSFAAVDKKDPIDDLFENEDQQRRREALEQEQASAPKRFMSWAGAALGKLTAGMAASKARADEQKAADQRAADQKAADQQAERRARQQQVSDDSDDGDYADPLADYTVDRARDDEYQDEFQAPSATHDQTGFNETYDEGFHEEFHEEFQQDTHSRADAADTDDNENRYSQAEAGPYNQHYDAPLTEEEKKIAKYGESPYAGHRFGVDSVPADPMPAAAPVASSPYSDSRPSAASPTQPVAARPAASTRAATTASARSLRENQLSLDMPQEDDDRDPGYSQVLVINVMARPKTLIQGDELLPLLLGAGLRFGEMSIFHRHADRKGGPVLFSVANALNPGTFDLNRISDFSTQGVCFFMTLPNVANNMLAFEQMLATAKHVQSALDAELKDDNRSVMTAQTVEHYRQRIRDFDLQQLKNSKNPRQK